VRLITAVLTILFLSETYEGRTHDKRIAEASPYPLPAGSRLLQDLGFLAFTLAQVEIIMPTRKPRGRKLTRAQKAANRRIARRRVRIEHVNSSVKRCRVVHETCRLRKSGIRDLIMEVCCALHNFRVRLTPWQPMV
jgi:DDE superfamily endonuclease